MEQDQVFNLQDYIYATWRRKWILLIVIISVLAIALFVITKLPIVYRSTGTVLIERQEIPEQWVSSTITTFADERIQAIGQRVLTTETLVQTIDKYGLFPDMRANSSLNQMASLARSNFSIDIVPRSGQNDWNRVTAAFRISYNDSSAERARDVATEMVNLYLNENIKARTQAATDTRRFLEEEANRIERQLAEIEKIISKFKEENVGVLPEHQTLNIQAYERVEQQIGDINRTLTSLQERRIVLESSIASARRVLSASRTNGVVAGVVINPERQRLKQLSVEYSSLQTRYSESHPDLKRLKREIGVLKSKLGANVTEENSPGSGAIIRSAQDDAAIIKLNSDLKTAIAEERSLRTRKKELENKLDDLELRINKTPGVELEYRTLVRDQKNIQDRYNDIRSKQSSARVSQSLEEEQKGERFTLIEAPRLATQPYSPNYKKLYVMVLGLAFLSGLGAVLGLEYLDGTIRNVRTVETLSGVPVLTTVGFLENSRDRRRRSVRKIIMISMLVSIGLGLLYIVKYYQLDAAGPDSNGFLESIKSWISSINLPR